MRCLLLGSTGLIGSHLAAACDGRQLPWLGTTYQQSCKFRVPLDLRDAEAVNELLHDYQPDITFLTAPTDLAAVERLVENLRAVRSKLVLFSPAEVFGPCRTAQRETDTPQGSSPRARLILQQEQLAQQRLEEVLIIRSSGVFGSEPTPRGPLSRWAAAWEQGQSVVACDQQLFQPTYAPDLAKVVLDLVQANVRGIFHIVGAERHSEFSFARLAAHVFGYDMDLVHPIRRTTEEHSPWLDRQPLRERFGSKAIRSTADGLRALKAVRSSSAATVRPLSRAA